MRSSSLLLLLFTLFSSFCWANDGSYLMAGNHLIPISDKSIQVKKEILSIKRNDRGIIEVSVHYEFYNNGPRKNIIVGFEAFPTYNTSLHYSEDGSHPYMRGFSVLMNKKELPYKISHVSDTLYKARERATINAHNFSKIKKEFESGEEGYFEYTFVYHFDATFEQGLNIIQHNYEYEPGGTANHHYDFDYILDAAGRWGNGVIEDFTLIIDVGPFQQYTIDKTFSKSASDWITVGKGEVTDYYPPFPEDSDFYLGVRIERGVIVYQKKNFKPSQNLFVHCFYPIDPYDLTYLPYNHDVTTTYFTPDTEIHRKIMYNLPFARRGYVFKNADIQRFYDTMPWYKKDPNYVPNVDELFVTEKEWLKQYK